MTYVSRRARIAVPRWPNDFDPEFLFRVGRRCDGRLKRHSSCHDLRAWINDNCIKNEYLLDLMSDGEVSLKPPLQLYGRFIPVPLLFKLLPNSRSENGAENTGSEKLGPTKQSHADPEERDQKPTVLWAPSEKEDTKPKEPEKHDKDNISKRPVASPGEKEDQVKEPGVSSGEKGEKTKPPRVTIAEESTKPKETGSSPGEETQITQVTGEKEGAENSRVYYARRKWDPFEKMEYYTSGFATEGGLVDGVHPLPTSTQSTLVIDDDYDNRKSRSESHRSESEGSLARVVWEKNIIEKNLYKSTCLLGRALGKLEKIDNIIQVANEDRERVRKGEIHEAFHHKSKINCIYIQSRNTSERSPSPTIKYRAKYPGDQERQESLKCRELLRQISGLREKLKKNQECQQRINQEIQINQREAESMTSPHMTDLNNRDGQAQLRRLQSRLERLISHRGKLLSEMCQALTNLNNLKRSRNSRVDLRQRSKSGEIGSPNYRKEQYTCSCMNYQSSESEKAHCSDSESSSDNYVRRVNYDDDKKYYDYSSTDNPDSGQQNLNDESHTKTDTQNEAYASNGEIYKDNQQEKEGKKSVLRFTCPEPPCKEQDLDTKTSEKYFRPGQQSYPRGTLANISPYRPKTSPTTKREWSDASEDRWCNSYVGTSQGIPERRAKSETTMKEIEKTLRNYEQRLDDLDGLEYKVEEWKRKLLEACQWKKNASKVEAQMQRDQEDERNRASTHINGLVLENCELKKRVQQLTEKSKEQAKKFQNMKNSVLKTRELQTETEELKKELSEYRNSYEHQRKCISKWESVVALQRKEIENLMNHIRKLTTEKKEQMSVHCQDRKCVQRTRSCSPASFVDCQSYCRPQSYNPRSDDENGSCCCQDFRQSDSRRSDLRCLEENFYSSLNEREDWCN